MSQILLKNEQSLSFTGVATKADAFFGNPDGFHSISISVSDFVGRVYIEATLANTPTDDDWFSILLTDTNDYIEYPVDPMNPTGIIGIGDTDSFGKNFRINATYIRARVDRDYLGDPEYDSISHGYIVSVLLSI